MQMQNSNGSIKYMVHSQIAGRLQTHSHGVQYSKVIKLLHDDMVAALSDMASVHSLAAQF